MMKLLLVRGMPTAVIVAAVVAVFANVFGNSWHYDDLHSITENPHLRSLRDPLRLLLDPTLFSRDADKAMFRPLLLSSFAVNYAWSQLQTWSWHLVNVGLHLGCALLLRQILQCLGRPRNTALFGALLFALHPLATEPVNYISSRSESLAALFVLASLWMHLRAAGSSTASWRAGSVIAFACGVLTKSVAITTPVLLLACDVCNDRQRSPLQAVRRRVLQRTWWPYVAVAVGYLVIIGAHVSRAVVSDAVRGPWEQFATQAKAVPHYARLIGFPVGLNVHHQFFEGAPPLVLLAAVAAALSLLYVGLRRDGRDVAFGLLWMVVVLSPTLVVPLHVLVNDHRLYLPLAGAVIVLTAPALRPAKKHTVLVLMLVLPLLGVTTHKRNQVWHNEFTLWSDAAAKSPSPLVPVAYVHLGNYAKEADRLVEAEGYFRRALEIDAEHIAARNNLGIVLQGLGRVEEAIALYEDITTERPDLAEGWYNLGKARQQLASERGQGDGEAARALELSARQAYQQAPLGGPHDAVILNNLGTTFERVGQFDSAAVFYVRSLQARADFDDARRNVMRLLRGLRDVASNLLDAGAYAELETLCEALLPGAALLGQQDPWPLFFVGVGRFAQGQYAESVAPTVQLVQQYPTFEEGYLQLGNLYETMGNVQAAAAVYAQHAHRVPHGTLRAESVARLRRLEAQ